MKIGDEVYIHGYIDEIRKDIVIIRNEGGYFGAVMEEIVQEPKTGHWIDDEFGSKCSYCGIHTHLDKFDRPMKFKYCSMCGAKMVEPQESEDKE